MTNHDLDILKRLFSVTWQHIAPDLHDSCETPTHRDTVFELCADADRLSEFAHTDEEKEVTRKFYDLSWEEQISLKEAVLPVKYYE